MNRKYLLFVKDILEAIGKIEEFIEGMNFDDFLADDRTKSAVVRKLEIIGEAAKNIPLHVRNRYPDIPWSSMAKMRNRLSHAYFTVDYEIIWKVLTEELPELKPKIKEVYESQHGLS